MFEPTFFYLPLRLPDNCWSAWRLRAGERVLQIRPRNNRTGYLGQEDPWLLKIGSLGSSRKIGKLTQFVKKNTPFLSRTDHPRTA